MSSSLAFRLSLARAFLQDSPITVIDEQPNDLLNGVSGQALKSLLIKQRGRRTILFVANRADLLRLADKVTAAAPRDSRRLPARPDMIFGLMSAA